MNLQDSFSVLMRRVLQKVFVIVEVMSIDHLMLVTSALCRMPYAILGSLPPQHHKHPISAWSILICLNTSRFESDTSFPRPVWGVRDSMSNETDGFNKILNGLQIAFYLLRFVFDHPSKTVLDSAGLDAGCQAYKKFQMMARPASPSQI